MTELFELSIDIQIMLVAGYAGYLVSEMGLRDGRPTHEAVLRVFGFAVLAHATMIPIVGFIIGGIPWLREGGVHGPAILIQLVLIVLAGLVYGSLWRRFGRPLMSTLMDKLGVYRDDHGSSVWKTVTAELRTIPFVHVYCDDGYILTADLKSLPERLRDTPILTNTDGISMYVTAMVRPDGEEVDTPAVFEDAEMLTYIPMSRIRRVVLGRI